MYPKDKSTTTSLLKNFIIGGCTAAVTKTVFAPVERVKLIFQVQASNPQMTGEKPYKGLINTLIRLPMEQGILSYWRGNFSNVLRSFPTHAFNFTFRDIYRRIFVIGIDKKENYSKYFAANVFSGGLAGGSALMCVYPLDYIHTRMSVDIGRSHKDREFISFLDCFRKTAKSDGLIGLYKGFPISLPGSIIFHALYFGVFDSISGNFDERNMSIIRLLINAQCVITIGALMSYPFDTVGRRMMMQSQKHRMYKNSIDCFTQIYNKEGPRAFYNGAFLNLIRGIGVACMIVMFDAVRKHL